MKQPSSHTRNTRIPTSNQHQFSEVPHADIQRSTFDRSHGLKTTFSAGDLVPIYVDEALPGDTFSSNMTAFARLSTPINPTMDNLYMDTHFFSVPVRLLWEDFQEFMGETQEGQYDATTGNAKVTLTPPIPHSSSDAGDRDGQHHLRASMAHALLWSGRRGRYGWCVVAMLCCVRRHILRHVLLHRLFPLYFRAIN
jgi:hypothetical protein